MKLATDFDFKTNVSDGFAAMIEPQPQRSIELRKSIKPFHDSDQRSLGRALNEEYWRHGITVSAGNGMSVSMEKPNGTGTRTFQNKSKYVGEFTGA